MLLGVQVPGFPGLVGGLVNMSCLGESPHPHHHHHPAHHAGPHIIHPGHHPRLPTRVTTGEEGQSPGHSPSDRRRTSPEPHHHPHPQRSDRYAPIKRLALVQIHPPRNPDKPLTPFGISDILTARVPKRKADDRMNGDFLEARKDMGQPAGSHCKAGLAPDAPGCINLGHSPGSIVRPWADSSSAGLGRGSPVSSRDESESEDEEIEVDDDPQATKSKLTQSNSQSPLDALLQMTSKTFDGMDASSMHSDGEYSYYQFQNQKIIIKISG